MKMWINLNLVQQEDYGDLGAFVENDAEVQVCAGVYTFLHHLPRLLEQSYQVQFRRVVH